nr:hypothetical protein GCM10020092_078370 [Actinoplanes digitatis]
MVDAWRWPPEETTRSPHELLALLVAEKVTVLCQTPSALRGLTAVLAREPAAREALALRVVILGGEALTAADVAGWFAVFGADGPRLVNMYGITETTVHTTYRPVLPADAAERAGSPIGGPLDDVTLYVLDGELAPVAEGIPGELYVGGAGVTRGYLGLPSAHRAAVPARSVQRATRRPDVPQRRPGAPHRRRRV